VEVDEGVGVVRGPDGSWGCEFGAAELASDVGSGDPGRLMDISRSSN
jgi:hypothetical protein